MPKLSIIIPVFNTPAEFLRDLENSLAQQSFKDFEVIVVYDGCGRSFEFTKLSNVKELFIERSGQAMAKQTGLNVADGEYLMFLDSDDYLIGSNSLSEIFEEIKDVAFIRLQDGRKHRQLNGVIFRRKLVNTLNLHFLPVGFYEDFYIVETLYEYAERTSAVMEYENPFYYYRHNPAGICNTMGRREKVRELFKIKEHIPERFLRRLYSEIIRFNRG